MDQNTYETITLGNDVIGDDRQLLADNLTIQIQKFNGRPIGLQFPPHVELAVASTEPGVRGDTASGGVTKLAVLETGLEIRVPLFIKEGEKVRVHTETGSSPAAPDRSVPFRRSRIRGSGAKVPGQAEPIRIVLDVPA